ncbi:MAG: hypothetical protein ABIL68_16695 [bacterium]
MLVQQFFGVEKYATFVNEKFIPFRTVVEEKEGEELRERYEVAGFPSVVFAKSDGSLYDILTSYNENPNHYIQRVQNALEGKETYAFLKAQYDRNPNDLKNAYDMANKHFQMWQSGKAAEYSRKILERSEEAKAMEVLLNDQKINLYEAARYAVALDELFDNQSPEALEAFRSEFHESILSDDVYSQLARAYLRLPLSDEGDAFYADLKEKYPENPRLLSRLVQYYTKKGENLDEGEKYARKLIALEPKSSGYRENAADLLLKKEQPDAAVEIYGESYMKGYMDDTGALNSYAWYWALKAHNLESALKAIKKAFRLNPKDANLLDTMSMVYWKMKDYQKAIEVEEKAYRMNPLSDYQERIEQIRKDMKESKQ